MALTAGTRVGSYEITGSLGAGGMGEVYRARDMKLDRDVAIKVLPDVFADDPERLARFQREAKTLAALNHPHIATIHGVEEHTDVVSGFSRTTRALVMELVEGETLAERIAQGPIPTEEALAIARQIAEALQAAHEQGIIHRDLKPANIKVRPDGAVKVLDFGLAKAFATGDGAAAALSIAATLTSPAATGLGVILGTAAYMAPEQAKGQRVDRRADIWAFGCVLYEMLTGGRAFGGEEMTETLAAVIRGEPDWTALPATTPAAVRRLLRRCLIKDPKLRLSDPAAVRLEIEDARTPEPQESSGTVRGVGWRRLLPYVTTAVMTVAAALPVGWLLARRDPAALAVMRFTVDLPPGVQLAGVQSGAPQRVAISANGGRIAYIGTEQGGVGRVYVRSVDRLDAAVLRIRAVDRPGSVFISPDGGWIGYHDVSSGELRKVPAGGGPTATICEMPGGATGFSGATWGSGGRIVFATVTTRGLMHVLEAGGTPQPLTTPPEGETHQQPHFLPDGRTIVFEIERTGEPDRIAVASLDAPQPRILLAGNSPKFASSGHLLFLREGAVWAIPFDARRLAVVGDAVPVLEGVAADFFENARYDVAANGTLVYSAGESGEARRTLTWVDRNGREETIPAPPRAYSSARLSPDGTRIAVDVREEDNDIWIWDLRAQTLTRTTFDRAQDEVPVWTPDGRRIAFRSNRDGAFNLFWRPADGTDAEQRLTKSAFTQVPTAFSPDGTRVVLNENAGTGGNIMTVELTGSRTVSPLLQTEFAEYYADVSPDGRWIAYQYLESNPSHVIVRPFADVQAGRWQASTMGGRHPVWSRDGRELFYLDLEGRLTSVEVDATGGFRTTTPRTILDQSYFEPIGMRSYDVSPDGQRFLMIKAGATAEGARGQLVVVLNWTEELKRLVPTN